MSKGHFTSAQTHEPKCFTGRRSEEGLVEEGDHDFQESRCDAMNAWFRTVHGQKQGLRPVACLLSVDTIQTMTVSTHNPIIRWFPDDEGGQVKERKVGGLVAFVNDRHSGHITIKHQLCSEDSELLAASC